MSVERFFSALSASRYRRGPKRILGGVLGGFSALTGLDVTWVRIGFLLFCLIPGPAFILYLGLWLLLPDQNGSVLLAKLFRAVRR